MQDSIGIGIPSCFSSDRSNPLDDPAAAVTRSGQSVFMSVYRTKLADTCRLITITWCKNSLLHGLSVSVQGPEGESQYTLKVEVKPWYFWRKQGSKRIVIEGNDVDIFWDLKGAKFNGETEPRSEYYVAVVCRGEVVLLMGDLKNDAYRKTGCRPSLIDPILVSRREHVFGKRKFSTRAKFHEKGRFHVISIECKTKNANSTNGGGGNEPEMEIRIDGNLVLNVKHLQWKFRGNESIHLNKVKVQVYWDVHDWLFCPGLRHALFIFKPSVHLSNVSTSSSSPLSSSSTSTTPLSSCGSLESLNGGGSSEFCLFLYAWKVE